MSVAIRMLREEHEQILAALDALERTARLANAGRRPSPELVRDLSDFFMLFAHRLHRDKEEDLLFPALQERGVHPEGGGCIGSMMAQHEDGDALLGQLLLAGDLSRLDDAAWEGWAASALEYSALLRHHIHRENEVLFSLAERTLTEADHAAMAMKFGAIEEKAHRSGIRERVEEILDRLEKARATGTG